MIHRLTAFVIGGGSGIGAAVARKFAALGASVTIGDVAGERAIQVAAEINEQGGSAVGRELDITDALAAEAAIDEIVSRDGGLDHVLSCAGIGTRHTIPQMTPEIWRRVIDVNLTGAFLAIKSTQGAIAARGGGTITVISSIAADHIAYLSGVHYAASKGALTGLVRQAAFELGRKQIRVNAVGPGPMSNLMGGTKMTEAQRNAAGGNLPLQRVVEPEDIAEACLFLASPAARAITGVYLPVDCGFLTGRGVRYAPYFEAHDEAF